jgi:hypothetical protein
VLPTRLGRFGFTRFVSGGLQGEPQGSPDQARRGQQHGADPSGRRHRPLGHVGVGVDAAAGALHPVPSPQRDRSNAMKELGR